MKEIWKDIEGFPGYQISSKGRVRTFWKKKHYPTGYGTYRFLSDDPQIMSASDDGNGYLKVMLYSKIDGKRYCRKIHRLVAEAFIPNHDPKCDTVDHKKSGSVDKLDNSVENLRWMPRRDNIQKAYRDGMCDDRIARQNKPIVAYDTWTGKEKYFHSIKEACEELRLRHSTIAHAVDRDHKVANRYYFEFAGKEDTLLYEHEDSQFISWV